MMHAVVIGGYICCSSLLPSTEEVTVHRDHKSHECWCTRRKEKAPDDDDDDAASDASQEMESQGGKDQQCPSLDTV